MTEYQNSLETTLPVYTEYIDQRFLIEPLSGPEHPRNYLDRFPDEIYHKGPETHLVRLIYSLVGPAGVGWLNKQYFDGRLVLEATGMRLFNLDAFYGDPFGFGRVASEIYPEADPRGILPQADWEAINASDARYRNRALNFFNGARAGTTPLGMKLVARSGINHEVEIIENYKQLFDIHADDAIGFARYGASDSLQEFVVVPRRELSESEEQTITFGGSTPTGGSFYLSFNGQTTTALPYNAEYWQVQGALQALSSIGPDGCEVYGGPAPNHPLVVKFTGRLTAKVLPLIQGALAFTESDVTIDVTSALTGKEPYEETTYITAGEKHTLYTALEKLKPVTSIPTLYPGSGVTVNIDWAGATASSEFTEVIRYVTGSESVSWPTGPGAWIRAKQEIGAPRIIDDVQFHYQGFHNVNQTWAYGEEALDDPDYENDIASVTPYVSEHVGRFHREQAKLPAFAYLRENEDDELRFGSDRITADYFEPLTVTTQTNDQQDGLINGIYPIAYSNLPGTPTIQYQIEQFWASTERTSGTEYIEIDFGQPVPVNFLTFDCGRKPMDIQISYDLLDQYPRRKFASVTPTWKFPNRILYDSQADTPWFFSEFHFGDALGQMVFTRFLRVGFTRLFALNEGFLDTRIDTAGNNLYKWPWSIDIKNLRVGRNVSNY